MLEKIKTRLEQLKQELLDNYGDVAITDDFMFDGDIDGLDSSFVAIVAEMETLSKVYKDLKIELEQKNQLMRVVGEFVSLSFHHGTDKETMEYQFSALEDKELVAEFLDGYYDEGDE